MVEEAVVAYAIEESVHGQTRVSNELRERGIFVSASGVRSICLSHHLESFRKRLKDLETKVAEKNHMLTESQIAALERKQQDDEVCGEIYS
ncbi:Uncharacterised protein [Suttonella ornithocola]|uniref:Transposase n=1 Tax=Suttonella ornithocola TaxID=279832 RepID=A0A380MYN6_9GAMM|nr:Uncharacterised protein [Suttonella ornithocola]